jgi:hypothetical protein
MAEFHTDRRHTHWVKDLIIPLIIAVVVGISSAVLTVRVSIAVISTEMVSLKEDVVDLKLVLQVVQENQLAKTRLDLLSTDNHEEIIKLWKDVKLIQAQQYTEKDAEVNMELLRREFQLNLKNNSKTKN